MPTGSEHHLWVSWAEYHHAIERLALRVYDAGWEFDQVLCLARGGMRPGDVFSRLFHVPLAILSTSSYRDGVGTRRGDLDIASYITMTRGPLAGKILLIDDLVDSGITLERVQKHLLENFPAVQEVRTAVIWCKACSAFKPDYFLEYLENNPWIHQPFEEYDGLSPQQLVDRLKRQDRRGE